MSIAPAVSDLHRSILADFCDGVKFGRLQIVEALTDLLHDFRRLLAAANEKEGSEDGDESRQLARNASVVFIRVFVHATYQQKLQTCCMNKNIYLKIISVSFF